MTFGSSILMFDSITLNAGSVDTHTFNTSRIEALTEYFRIIFKADAYNDAIGYDGMYEPKIKIRVVANCESGDVYEYLLFPINPDGRGFYQDIRLRSGAYNTFTFSIINDSDSALHVTQVKFCPESREEDMTYLHDESERMVEELADSIGLSLVQYVDGDGRSYIKVSLTVGDKEYTGTAVIEGNLQIQGQLSADQLYAAVGDIADLTVDHLSTSRRIVRFLAGNTDDDNYLDIAEEHIYFMAGIYAGGTEQAVNPYGALLYWEADPNASDVTIGADGYPYYNGVRIFTTTSQTAYPVMVYTYTEQTKARFEFDTTPEGYYMPFLTLGAGDQTGNNKGFIIKDNTKLQVTFTTSEGKEIGMVANNTGYLDLLGVRRTTSMDFSRFDSGSFSEVIEGSTGSITYQVTFDSEQRPIKITHPDGHECTITW